MGSLQAVVMSKEVPIPAPGSEAAQQNHGNPNHLTFKDALMGMRGSVNYVLNILPAMNFHFLGHDTLVQHTTSILFETQVVKKDGLVKQIVCCSKKKAGRVLYAGLIRTTKLFGAISRNT